MNRLEELRTTIRTHNAKQGTQYLLYRDETECVPELCAEIDQLRSALAEKDRSEAWALAEVADHERWFKEMVADYRLQSDDHKASWRYAINCKIHDLRDKVAALEEDKRKQSELVTALREYIGYLHESDTMTSGFLYAHNWKYPEELIERGNRLREIIADKQAALSSENPRTLREGEEK